MPCEFQYELYKRKGIKPEEIFVLDNTDGSKITLMMYTHISLANPRLIVKGKIIEK